jgi:hypothetical protein
MHYPDRVCFGSDAFLYQPETVLDYLEMVKDLKLPEEIEALVFNGNPARFLGRALHGSAGTSSGSGQRPLRYPAGPNHAGCKEPEA